MFPVIPTPAQWSRSVVTNYDLGRRILSSIKACGHWSDETTKLLEERPQTVYEFDRVKCYMNKVIGHHDKSIEVTLSPMHMLCFEPECLQTKPIINLKAPNCLDSYQKHLQAHVRNFCEISTTIEKRMSGSNLLSTVEELDAKCDVLPVNLIQTEFSVQEEQARLIKNVKVVRDLDGRHYLSVWLNFLLNGELIPSSSLIYQQLEATVQSVLCFPNPMANWDTFPTLQLFSLAMYSIATKKTQKLFRGLPTTNQKKEGKKEPENIMISHVRDHLKQVNHLAPSQDSLVKFLLPLSFSAQTVHKSVLTSQLAILSTNDNAVRLETPNSEKFLVSLVLDEQPLCRSTHIHADEGGEYLLGLEVPMTASSIFAMGGLDMLLDGIANGQIQYIKAVLEFRSIDLAGIFSANVYTVFQSKDSTSDDFALQVKLCNAAVNTCERCTNSGVLCEYNNDNDCCDACASQGNVCKGLKVISVTMDMASDHKKASVQIEEECQVKICYGIYHTAKAMVNHARNYTLSLNDNLFSTQLLMSMYLSDDNLLPSLPQKVLTGRDRQSDDQAYRMIGPEVQLAFSGHGDYYMFQRYPDPYQAHKFQAKKQVAPNGLSSLLINANGDILFQEASEDVLLCLSSSVYCLPKKIKLDKPQNMRSPVRLGIGVMIDTVKNGASHVVRVYRETGTLITVVVSKALPHTIARTKGHGEDDDIEADVTQGIVSVDEGDVEMAGTSTDHGPEKDGSAQKGPLQSGLSEKGRIVLDIKEPLSSLKINNEGILFSVENGIYSRIFIVEKADILAASAKPKTKKHKALQITPKELGYVGSSGLQLTSFSSDNSSAYWIVCSSQESITIFKSDKSRYRFVLSEKNVNHILLTEVLCMEPMEKLKFVVVYTDHIKFIEFSCEMRSLRVLGQRLNLIKPPIAVCQKGTTIYVANEDAILVCTKANDILKFLKALETLYNGVGYASTETDRQPTNRLKTSLSTTLAMYQTSIRTIKEFEIKQTPRGKQSAGAVGFIAAGTLRCLYKTVDSLQVIIELYVNSSSIRNKDKIKIQSLLSESWIEHSFGNITQSAQSESCTLQEYIQQKRKNEIRSLLQCTETPFEFQPSKTKDYAPPPKSKMPAMKIMRTLRYKSSPLQSITESRSMANSAFLKRAFAATKGARAAGNRSKYRATWNQNPSTITRQRRHEDVQEDVEQPSVSDQGLFIL